MLRSRGHCVVFCYCVAGYRAMYSVVAQDVNWLDHMERPCSFFFQVDEKLWNPKLINRAEGAVRWCCS